MLSIRNLHASVDGKKILQGIELHINAGEVHAVMGPNGAGKSTLAKILAGHPAYEIMQGDILFKGQSILELDPEERAALGLFMSFQYPPEISGVSNALFLQHALNAIRSARQQDPLSDEAFDSLLTSKMKLVNIREDFKSRDVNAGFSGGEKKRNEILQMAVLEPALAILDETDSGLDIDAMRIIADGINKLMGKDKALLLITHYERLLTYIQPDFVHVLAEGKIVKTGDASLATELEKKGYQLIS